MWELLELSEEKSHARMFLTIKKYLMCNNCLFKLKNSNIEYRINIAFCQSDSGYFYIKYFTIYFIHITETNKVENFFSFSWFVGDHENVMSIT